MKLLQAGTDPGTGARNQEAKKAHLNRKHNLISQISWGVSMHAPPLSLGSVTSQGKVSPELEEEAWPRLQ